MIAESTPIALYQMPSTQQFLRLLSEDFAARRSVVILVPDGVDTALLWTQIEAGFWQRSMWYQMLRLPEMQYHSAPLMALAHDIVEGSSLNPPRSIKELIEAAESWPDILVLSGIQELNNSDREVWFRFISRWAEESQGFIGQELGSPSLCVIVPVSSAEHNLPVSNVKLAIHWYWGFPSALEVQLLCQITDVPDDYHTTAARWRAHIIPAIAGNDIGLLSRLWDCCMGSLEDIWSALDDLAKERKWTEPVVRSWQAQVLINRERQQYGQTLVTPPVALQGLWACGAILWTQEYGLELHPAALIVLQRHDTLKHRVWRGQAKLLLPLLDHLRLEICEYLTRSYGSDWPIRWHPPLSNDEIRAVKENPLACQWGHLEWLLRNCSQLRAERRYVGVASCAWKIRNRIAHYEPVNYSDFTKLTNEMNQLPIDNLFR